MCSHIAYIEGVHLSPLSIFISQPSKLSASYFYLISSVLFYSLRFGVHRTLPLRRFVSYYVLFSFLTRVRTRGGQGRAG